jgi:pantoate kinase
MPACKVSVRTVIGKEAESETDKVAVSDNTTTSRRVDDMSHEIEDVLSEILKNPNFALHIDESTDITNKARLLVFV